MQHSLTPSMILDSLALDGWLRAGTSAESDAALLQQQDEHDLAEIRNGNHDAYSRIIGRHQAHIARMMWRFCREHGRHEELVQDVFVEGWNSLQGYRGKSPLRHWLSRIATRRGYAFWRESDRQRMRHAGAVDLQCLVARDGKEAESEQLHALLMQLPRADRLVLVLRYIEGYSVSETSGLTGWNSAVVKVRSQRARAKLAKLVSQQEWQ